MPPYGVTDLGQIAEGIGLSPCRRQAITGANADILINGPLETDFSELSIKMQTFYV